MRAFFVIGIQPEIPRGENKRFRKRKSNSDIILAPFELWCTHLLFWFDVRCSMIDDRSVRIGMFVIPILGVRLYAMYSTVGFRTQVLVKYERQSNRFAFCTVGNKHARGGLLHCSLDTFRKLILGGWISP